MPHAADATTCRMPRMPRMPLAACRMPCAALSDGAWPCRWGVPIVCAHTRRAAAAAVHPCLSSRLPARTPLRRRRPALATRARATRARATQLRMSRRPSATCASDRPCYSTWSLGTCSSRSPSTMAPSFGKPSGTSSSRGSSSPTPPSSLRCASALRAHTSMSPRTRTPHATAPDAHAVALTVSAPRPTGLARHVGLPCRTAMLSAELRCRAAVLAGLILSCSLDGPSPLSYATTRMLLTKHRALVASFLDANYVAFFAQCVATAPARTAPWWKVARPIATDRLCRHTVPISRMRTPPACASRMHARRPCKSRTMRTSPLCARLHTPLAGTFGSYARRTM